MATSSQAPALEALLRRVPGVTFVSSKPLGKANRINDFGVSYKIRNVAGDIIQRRKPCTIGRPTVEDCLRAILDELSEELGPHAVPKLPSSHEPDEEGEREDYTADELNWLAEWCDSHPTPETISKAEASEALRLERAKRGRSAFGMLKESQLLLALERSSRNAVERAKARLSNVQERLSEYHNLSKRQRTDEDWQRRPYASYDLETWRRLEGEMWSRRRKPLSDKPGRLKMPRGERDGALHHWRRGLVGAVCDWAEGSKEDAVTLILALIKELGLRVSSKCDIDVGHVECRKHNQCILTFDMCKLAFSGGIPLAFRA